MKSPRRILIVKPSSLGDVIHTLPVIFSLNQHWPEAELRWLINPAWRFLVDAHPGVSETILFPRDKFRGPTGWMRSVVWTRLLRDWKPDLAIDFQGLLRSALFARISGADRVIGLSDAREGARLFYGETVCVNRDEHAVRRYLTVLDHLGIVQPTRPEFVLPQGKLPTGFNTTTPYIVLHPYARGEGKSLSPDLVRAFAKGVAGHRLIIVGRGAPILELPVPVEDWSNRTDLLELLGILSGATFVVSVDSGPMHMAAALNPARTLAIHLWSDPLKVGPCFPESLVWKNGLISRVAGLTESWRPEGRVPTLEEMEELGVKVAKRKI